MKPPPPPGILLVAARELRLMRRDGLALFLAIGVPLFAFTILAWTFSNTVIRDLNVSAVDADSTPTSRLYIEAIDAAPGVNVTHRSSTLTGAMQAIRSGQAIAAVYIPPDFERDLLDKKRPQIVVFYNRQFFTPGNNASAAISSAINATTSKLAPASRAKPAFEADFRGLGVKSPELLLQRIQNAKLQTNRVMLIEAETIAERVSSELRKNPAIKKFEITGSFRRRKETIGDMDVLAVSDSPEKAVEKFTKSDEVREVIVAGDFKASVKFEKSFQVDLRIVPNESWGAALLYFTGSKQHKI
jgi:predicted nucleotidyltransferase